MADLAGRWGVTAQTVSRRLSFLGIKPLRQGNYRFITAEQLALADELQAHILSGKPQESFPRPDQPEGSALVARHVQEPAALVPGHVDQLTALAAAMAAAMPHPPADPLQRARALAEAADNGLVLDNAELKALGVKGVAGKKEDTPAHGYLFRRHQPDGEGGAVFWTVERVLGTCRATSPTPGTSGTTSRQVGFGLGGTIAACLATVEVSAVELPSWRH